MGFGLPVEIIEVHEEAP